MQKVTITATINDDKIEKLVERFNKNRDLIAKVIDTLFDMPDVTITTTVKPVEPSPRKLECQSENHNPPDDCYGELWQCAGCNRIFCEMEGADDEYPALCDDCYGIVIDHEMGCDATMKQKAYMEKYHIKDAHELVKVGK